MSGIANSIASSSSVSVSVSSSHHLLPLLLPSSASPRSLSSSSSAFSVLSPLFLQRKLHSHSRRHVSVSSSSLNFRALANADDSVEVLVKAAVGEPEKIGDCKFSFHSLASFRAVLQLCKTIIRVLNYPFFLEINPTWASHSQVLETNSSNEVSS